MPAAIGFTTIRSATKNSTTAPCDSSRIAGTSAWPITLLTSVRMLAPRSALCRFRNQV